MFREPAREGPDQPYLLRLDAGIFQCLPQRHNRSAALRVRMARLLRAIRIVRRTEERIGFENTSF
jgi:hypothetical protein